MSASEYIDGEYVDVTDRVECYENGKTFECDCGQGFGVEFEVHTVRCPTCGETCVDESWESREAPERETGQMTLGDF